MRTRFIAILLTLIGPGAAALWANWGSTAGGSVATGNFRSFGTAQVEMLHEDLVIRLYRERARVEIDYILHNTGAAVDVRAGFPSLGARQEDEEGHAQEQKEIEDYAIVADGRPVSVTRQKGDPTPLKSLYTAKFRRMGEFDEYPAGKSPELLEWFASTVHFAENQTRHIHISYESLYAFCTGGYSDDSDTCDDRFAYVLSTAAAWKGPIGDGHVTIRAMTIDPKTLTISPKGRFAQTKQGFVWNFHDLKPTMADNIVVSLNNHSSTIASYDDQTETNGDADENYYVYEGGRYFYLTQSFTPSGSSAGEGFGPDKVRDLLPETEWRTAHSPGIGDSLTLKLKRPGHFDQVGIVPGCGKDKRAWFSHTRISEIEVTVNGGRPRRAAVPDEYITIWPDSYTSYQWVNLPPYSGDADEITLTIRGIYPGSQDQVTCIDKVMLRRWLPSRPNVKSGVDDRQLP